MKIIIKVYDYFDEETINESINTFSNYYEELYEDTFDYCLECFNEYFSEATKRVADSRAITDDVGRAVNK